jgi:hypothetical protein
MDDNQKKIILQLAIDTKFFHSAFVKNHRRSRRGVRFTAHLDIESLMANYCTVWDAAESLKGSHRMEDGRKTSTTLPLIKIYRMSRISAWSISLDSIFKTTLSHVIYTQYAIIWRSLQDLKDSNLTISWLRLDPIRRALCVLNPFHP